MNNFSKIKGLYIHIPFCNNICNYCDFFKIVAGEKFINEYCNYLVKELVSKRQLLKNLKTIYIGGGTPSALSEENLIKIFRTLQANIDFDKIVEFTVEANPLDITLSFLNLLITNKVSRLSIGVQSFDDLKLSILGRKHTSKDLVKMFDLLKNKNFKVNCDIIYGLKNDNFKKIKKDLVKLLKNKVQHISLYALSLEEKTIFMKKFEKNNFEILGDDESFEIYHKSSKFLKRKKFIHYEISNFGKKNHFSEHNLIYWNNENYLGIGCAASSHLNSIRYTNPKKFKDYYELIESKSSNYYEFENLTLEESMKEEVILNLRKKTGIDTMIFYKKYNKNIFIVFPNLHKIIQKKLLKYSKNHIFIPESKFYISNYIINEVI